MNFLANLIPVQYRLLAGLVVALMALAAAAFGGWHVRGWEEDAARLDAERKAHALLEQKEESWGKALQAIAGERELERQQGAADRRQWQKELEDAKRSGSLVVCGAGLRDPEAGAAVGGGGRLSGDFVRLYNAGLAVGLPEALRPWRADGDAAGADSSVAPEDVLDNVEANAEQCNDLRGQILAWQRWARSIGAAR